MTTRCLYWQMNPEIDLVHSRTYQRISAFSYGAFAPLISCHQGLGSRTQSGSGGRQ